MPASEAPLVLLCNDLGSMPSPLRLGEVIARLHRAQPGTAVLVVPRLCESPKVLAEALAGVEARRVVVGCRANPAGRAELLAGLRKPGVSIGGTEVVDLRTAEGCSERVALEQSVVLLRAALALVAAADVDEPVRDRVSLCSGGLPRRALLTGSAVARCSVAVWRSERCEPSAACTACVAACPYEALHREAGRIVVTGDRCRGCGACAAACRRGAFALPGADFEGLEAAVGVLVEAVGHDTSATGVAITCRSAKVSPRVGTASLTLLVPSLAMVSAGWLLQLLSAGASVRVVACEDKDCKERAGDLERFVADLGLGPGCSLPEPPGSGAGRGRRSGLAGPASSTAGIELREPEATIGALVALGALDSSRTSWRAAGAGCSLGVLRIDEAECSACKACEAACPTGALLGERSGGGSLRLSIDPRRCTGCGACVASCPESVITVEKAADGAMLASGRRVAADVTAATCVTCGEPLLAGLSPAVMRRRLGPSHSAIAGSTKRICADCRLTGRSATVSPMGS